MAVSRTDVVQAKVGDWKQAFDMVAADIHTPGMLEILGALQSDEAMRDLPLYIQLARVVNANQRAAATVAALLVANGVKPTAFDYGDDS